MNSQARTPHRYSIRPKDPAAHIFEVRLDVAQPDEAGQIFAMPAWIPGSYMIRDYAKHVVTARAESDGRDVPLQKLDKSRWQAAPTASPSSSTTQPTWCSTPTAPASTPCSRCAPTAPTPTANKRPSFITKISSRDWGSPAFTLSRFHLEPV